MFHTIKNIEGGIDYTGRNRLTGTDTVDRGAWKWEREERKKEVPCLHTICVDFQAL
jgi:hypothetical protein